MIYVKIELSYARCCMTAELCCFHNYGQIANEQLISRFSARIASNLKECTFYKTSDIIYAKGETTEEAWKNALEGVQEDVGNYSYNGQQVRYIWFVDYGDGWEHEELRTIIKEMPGVVRLGKYTNANTRNKLDGYMAVFHQENGSDGDDD